MIVFLLSWRKSDQRYYQKYYILLHAGYFFLIQVPLSVLLSDYDLPEVGWQ